MLKKVSGNEFDVIKRTIAATKLLGEDSVVFIDDVVNGEQIVLQTGKGIFLRFPLEEVPEKKKGAVGVRGIRLEPGDEVEGVYLLESGSDKTAMYRDKEVSLTKLRIGKRDTKGVKTRL